MGAKQRGRVLRQALGRLQEALVQEGGLLGILLLRLCRGEERRGIQIGLCAGRGEAVGRVAENGQRRVEAEGVQRVLVRRMRARGRRRLYALPRRGRAPTRLHVHGVAMGAVACGSKFGMRRVVLVLAAGGGPATSTRSYARTAWMAGREGRESFLAALLETEADGRRRLCRSCSPGSVDCASDALEAASHFSK